nr:hypothetical protein GCM10020092_041650 [Actinoplanes digitatis]
MQLPSGAWRLYFDQYGAGRYYYADSTDLNTWSAKTELPGLSGTVRHFTVLRENVGDSTAVPTGNRSLRSANFTDRYVRHRDNLGYIDPLSSASSTADRQSATFTVGASLANGNCYSLQSINPTGRYLRHYNNRLVLAANDGTATFRNDATFCGRAEPVRHRDDLVRVVQLPGLLHPALQLRAAHRPQRRQRHPPGGRLLHRHDAARLETSVRQPCASPNPHGCRTASSRGRHYQDRERHHTLPSRPPHSVCCGRLVGGVVLGGTRSVSDVNGRGVVFQGLFLLGCGGC